MMRLSAPIHELKRRAKLMARQEKIALHRALDRVAGEEGFHTWSLLSAKFEGSSLPRTILSRLDRGDLFLIAARPGHGKTTLGLEMLHAAARSGRRAVFFTLEYSEKEARQRLGRIGEDAAASEMIEIITSEDISSDFIIRHLSDATPESFAIIDYLQILDQRRNKPSLDAQVSALSTFARQAGIMIGFISQVDRKFDPTTKGLPDITDVRMPNLVDTALFAKACFLHGGETRLQNL